MVHTPGFQAVIFLALTRLTTSSIFYTNPFNSAWIKLCEHPNFEVKATQCPSTVSLLEPIQVNCLCVNGLWALKSESLAYFLVFGEGHCFELNNSSISKIWYIGKRPTDPFESADFSGIKGSFQDVSGLRAGDSVRGIDLLRINPDFPLTLTFRNRESACLQQNESEPDHRVLIYELMHEIDHSERSSSCVAGSQGLRAAGVEQVADLRVGHYFLWNTGEVVSASQKCTLSCKPSLLREILESSRRRKRSTPVNSCPESYVQKGLTTDQREKLINEESERIIVANNAFVFHLMQGPKLTTVPQWTIFQKVKQIFEAFCPRKEISEFVLNGMTRMFRYLIAYSRDKFAGGMSPRYKSKNARLLDTLNTCLEEAEPFELYFESKMDCVNYTVGGVTGYDCTCTTFPTGVRLTEEHNLTLTTILPTILPAPHHFRLFNESDPSDMGLDFPIETAWKMILFVHYKCNPYFNHTALDLSHMQMSLETLFNDAVQYRWQNPGNSFKAYERAFSLYDLRLFAKATDACVATAKWQAYYPEWILRPATRDREEVIIRGKRSLGKHRSYHKSATRIWNNKAYCN